MAITKIKASNFKSFDDVGEIKLGNFNVLIGANASGKSNFVQIFKFLRDISNYGLENAISLQGGTEYLRNAKIGSTKDFSLQISTDSVMPLMLLMKKGQRIIAKTYEVEYKFTIKFNKRGWGYQISEDCLTLKCNFLKTSRGEKQNLGQGNIILKKVGAKLEYDINVPDGQLIHKEDISIDVIFKKSKSLKIKRLPKSLLMEDVIPLFPMLLGFEDIANIAVYDFDPKLSKKVLKGVGKTELDEDGNNLAIVLKNLREDSRKKKDFTNLINDMLPFITDWKVEAFTADKSLLFTLKEKYYPGRYLPASSISDGTINIATMIVALYFNNKSTIVIEEPERNIHPFLVSKAVSMFKEASEKKQIIVTTHNPEIVKHAGLENLLLVSRDKDGFSRISKPGDKTEVKTFIENQMGLDELFVQRLLEV
jgi:predicted ATPase